MIHKQYLQSPGDIHSDDQGVTIDDAPTRPQTAESAQPDIHKKRSCLNISSLGQEMGTSRSTKEVVCEANNSLSTIMKDACTDVLTPEAALLTEKEVPAENNADKQLRSRWRRWPILILISVAAYVACALITEVIFDIIEPKSGREKLDSMINYLKQETVSCEQRVNHACVTMEKSCAHAIQLAELANECSLSSAKSQQACEQDKKYLQLLSANCEKSLLHENPNDYSTCRTPQSTELQEGREYPWQYLPTFTSLENKINQGFDTLHAGGNYVKRTGGEGEVCAQDLIDDKPTHRNTLKKVLIHKRWLRIDTNEFGWTMPIKMFRLRDRKHWRIRNPPYISYYFRRWIIIRLCSWF